MQSAAASLYPVRMRRWGLGGAQGALPGRFRAETMGTAW